MPVFTRKSRVYGVNTSYNNKDAMPDSLGIFRIQYPDDHVLCLSTSHPLDTQSATQADNLYNSLP